MSAVSQRLLHQMAAENSVIFIRGRGPCPVFARGDQRTLATHWLSRESVKALKLEGLLQSVPRGLSLSEYAKKQLLRKDPIGL